MACQKRMRYGKHPASGWIQRIFRRTIHVALPPGTPKIISPSKDGHKGFICKTIVCLTSYGS